MDEHEVLSCHCLTATTCMRSVSIHLAAIWLVILASRILFYVCLVLLPRTGPALQRRPLHMGVDYTYWRTIAVFLSLSFFFPSIPLPTQTPLLEF